MSATVYRSMQCGIVLPTEQDLKLIEQSLCDKSTNLAGAYEPLHTEDRLRQVYNGLLDRIVNVLSAKGLTVDKEELRDDANVRLENLLKSSRPRPC